MIVFFYRVLDYVFSQLTSSLKNGKLIVPINFKCGITSSGMILFLTSVMSLPTKKKTYVYHMEEYIPRFRNTFCGFVKIATHYGSKIYKIGN